MDIAAGLGALGVLIGLFLVVAAVGEQVVETLRGVFPTLFARVGIPTLKGGLSVEDALRTAREMLPDGAPALARAEALVAVGQAQSAALATLSGRISAVADSIRAAAGGALTGEVPTALTAELAALTTAVNERLAASESTRVVALRFLNFLVCLAVCLAGGFNAFAITNEAFPGLLGRPVAATGAEPAALQAFLGNLAQVWLVPAFGYVATAFAASSGSGYWHDQLDRVRALKAAVGSAQQIIAQT